MNYILNFIFLTVILILYYYFGSNVLHIVNSKNKSFSLRIISGFIFVYFLGFIIGFPSQLFSISWRTFSILYAIILLFFIVLFFKIDKKSIQITQFPTKSIIINHLKKYWFVYLLVLIFSVLSITNLQPYYMNNYHDDYYISKVVSLAGSDHLLNKDYMLGTVIKKTSMFGLALGQGYRLFNTYELIYSFWGSIFHIDLCFFCRFTMVIHNYIIVFLSYQLVASIFMDENIAQFALLFFSFLMIPSGYASRGLKLFSIKMFENWRFQTAIFYGGSVTRVIELPLIVFSLSSFMHRVTIKKIFAFCVLILTMISFQTNALGYLLLSLPFMIIALGIYYSQKRFKRKKALFITIILLCVAFLLIILVDPILQVLPINLANAEANAKSYYLYYVNVFKKDFFALTALTVLLITIWLFRKSNQRCVSIFVLCLFLVFRLNKSGIFLNLISYFFYGTARILTSVLLLCVLFTGIMTIGIVKRIKVQYQKNVIVFLSLCLVLGTPTYIFHNRKIIATYNAPEDGMTKFGFSLKPLRDNDKMLPDIYVEVGQYFNKLKGGPFKILTEKNMPYDNTTITAQPLLFTSKKIELCYDDTWYHNNDYDKLDQYLSGKIAIDDVALLIQYSKSQYILTTRKKIKDDLYLHGYKVVINNNEKKYWLLKGHF